jgi:hypothetical protein
MAEEQPQITYVHDGKTYDANKFTNEGKVLLTRISRLNTDIELLSVQMDNSKAASLFYKEQINAQLTDDMLVEEEATEEPVQSDSHEI